MPEPEPSIEDIRAMGALAAAASTQSLPEQMRDGAADDLGDVMDRLPAE